MTAWMRELNAVSRLDRPARLEELVAEEFRTALLMTEADDLPLEESYFALGLTSLGAVEIKQRLEGHLGRPIDAASLVNNPSVGALLAHLRTHVLADVMPAAPVSAGAAGPDVTVVPRSLVHELLKDL